MTEKRFVDVVEICKNEFAVMIDKVDSGNMHFNPDNSGCPWTWSWADVDENQTVYTSKEFKSPDNCLKSLIEFQAKEEHSFFI